MLPLPSRAVFFARNAKLRKRKLVLVSKLLERAVRLHLFYDLIDLCRYIGILSEADAVFLRGERDAVGKVFIAGALAGHRLSHSAVYNAGVDGAALNLKQCVRLRGNGGALIDISRRFRSRLRIYPRNVFKGGRKHGAGIQRPLPLELRADGGWHLIQKLLGRRDHLLYQIRPPFEDVFLLALKSPDATAAALNPDNLCQDKRDQYRKHREPCGMGDSEAHRRMGGLSLQKHRHIHRDILHPILPPVILGINQILVHYPVREFGAEFVQ